MPNFLKKIIDKYQLKRHFESKADRVVLYNATSTIPNTFFAVIKIGIGLVLWSMWFLIFGGYYLALLLIRVYFFWRYSQTRKANLGIEERQNKEISYLHEGGILYSSLGIMLMILSGYMLMYGHNQKYDQNVTLLIALIGFVKIVTAIVGWIKSRHFKSPIITFLKSVNIADGLVAIILTQYALLSYQNTPGASHSTGLFGVVIGAVIMFIGIVITIKSRRVKNINTL